MNSIEEYEVRAEAFRLMTGHMAPGKDAAPESYPAPFEERSEAYKEWAEDNAECVRAMMLAFKHVMDCGN
ncbi:MAG: hypothetical protein GY954_18640 [Alteromonas sp.]|nr:hypothetical protein [Alteromonas sp.]